MSYGVGEALQRAVYGQLQADAGLAALVAGAIYDEMPSGAAPETFVSLGPEEVRDRSYQTGGMAEHRITVSVVSGAEGFAVAKAVAAAVSEALVDADLVLTRGRLVALRFFRARARRVRGREARRIDLIFRAIVEDN